VAHDDNKTPEAHLAMKKWMGERDGTGANRMAITSLQVMAQISTPGPTPSGSPAETVKSVQLAPELPCYLQGYPVEWLFAAPDRPAKKKRTGTVRKPRSKDTETR